MNKEYVLITGATGFIGSHIVEELLLDGSYTIVAIVRKTNNYKNVEQMKKDGVFLVEGNFYDREILNTIFDKYPIQAVIHVAALRGSGVARRDDYYTVNSHGTKVLLEASFNHQIKKFIFCSSIGVFGTIPSKLPANLNTELKGDNAYHDSKIRAEAEVQEFIKKGMDAYILRPAITYGTGDRGFPTTLIKLVRRRMFLLPFRDNKIHLLDVNKFAELFIKILKTHNPNNRIFIVADEAPILLRELVDIIYHYYFKKTYPSFLKLPNVFFCIILIFFKAINNEKWATRLQLILKNWYYDATKTFSSIGFKSANTKKEFLKYLQTF